MSVFDLIPTSNDLMSVYTLVALTVVVTSTIAIDGIIVKWILNEFKTIRSAIDGHDDYINNTNGIINKIHIDLAVQDRSMVTLEADIAEIKADVKVLLKR
jgi:hypothetical protein